MEILRKRIFNFSLHLHRSAHFYNSVIIKNELRSKVTEKRTAKEIRDLFLKYFINEKGHTYVPSSPVFLNNDPTLLFVNAGMNQFRSVLLDKTFPGHPFHNLKRAANSQKCIRLSGKHNDLNEVGVDIYHHTFFEMLGNWSFGDYSKFDACKMAWKLLTDVYGLNPQNLYVTYFNGDKELGLPADKDTENIWLEIGVPENHIFPFGSKDNFWEMADTGPCGPCTEIHYDFSSLGHKEVARMINANSPNVMEIWNLVFIQYLREKDGQLTSLPTLKIDTGMGFERLCAVLQGTQSNYDTDLFQPIFQAIQTNFKVRPYQGKTGIEDIDGFDTAYRILGDHSRMFSIAIADGIFPDAFEAGHVLRKIIRRAAYNANRVMKTRPGVLSSLVPYVADTLEFFPEITKHVNDITYIVNDEEKMFHNLINKGRKVRNKMLADGAKDFLDGNQLWELRQVHGLEEKVVQDLASEVNLRINWENYEQVKNEKQALNNKEKEKKSNIVLELVNSLKKHSVPFTNDRFKYIYRTDANNYGVERIKAKVVAILNDNQVVNENKNGSNCILVTDKTNFYSEAGGQSADIGTIYNKDFVFNVEHVSSTQGFVFHHGIVHEGNVQSFSDVQLDVDREHRMSCSQNHTATHILNTVLRRILPYTSQRSSVVYPSNLRFGFSTKSHLTLEQLQTIEHFANQLIKENLQVTKTELSFEELLNHPKAILLRGEEYPETVSVITIGNQDIASIEPCCGTHVRNTADIGSFLLIPSSKGHSGTTKYISAVTGKQVSMVRENGRKFQRKVLDLKSKVDAMIKPNVPASTHLELLKEVRNLAKECREKYDAPLLVLKECDDILKDLKLRLTDLITTASELDMLVESSEQGTTKPKVSPQVINTLKSKKILPTNDKFKYDCSKDGVKPIDAKVLALLRDDEVVASVERGLRCQLILNNTNFYSEDDDQASDKGILSCKDYVININSVYNVEGYVFHDGFIEKGTAASNCTVTLSVNYDHRWSCSQNHTALHLLNSAITKELTYFFPHSANAGSKEVQLYFTSKGTITDDQLQRIEKNINESIDANLEVTKSDMDLEALKEIPQYKSPLIKKFNKTIPVVTIGKHNDVLHSIEPCCGTHVSTTRDIGSFIITGQKNNKNNLRVIRAVTGNQALFVEEEGENYVNQISQLQEHVKACLGKSNVDHLELWDCLMEVKVAKSYHEMELPLLLFHRCQTELSELTKLLREATEDFVQYGFEMIKSEMQCILQESSVEKFIVHQLSSVGDGKKIINYAIENSGDKPSLYFAQDGHKSIICSCSVPKSLVSPTFSALLWINPVASVLEGQARFSTKNQELNYSVVSKRTDKVEEAITVAKYFIMDHLGNQ